MGDQIRWTRREMLGTLGAAAGAAFLTGCEYTTYVRRDLPDPGYLPTATLTSLVPDQEPYAPTQPFVPVKPAQPIVPPADTFGIIPRSVWARGGPNLATINKMDGVRLLTFHHSGDPKPFLSNDFSETALHLEYVREYHRSRNFQDIGYHFGIDRMGRVWQLRSLLYEGQHVRYHNEHNLGVVVLGNFDLQAPTAAQKAKIRSFGLLLRRQYKLPISRVYTHQELVSTECPGNNMQPYMVAVRRQGLI